MSGASKVVYILWPYPAMHTPFYSHFYDCCTNLAADVLFNTDYLLYMTILEVNFSTVWMIKHGDIFEIKVHLCKSYNTKKIFLKNWQKEKEQENTFTTG